MSACRSQSCNSAAAQPYGLPTELTNEIAEIAEFADFDREAFDRAYELALAFDRVGY